MEQKLGSIDMRINDAFISVFLPFAEIGMAEFARVTQVAYLGYVHRTRAVRMVPRDHEAIVQVVG